MLKAPYSKRCFFFMDLTISAINYILFVLISPLKFFTFANCPFLNEKCGFGNEKKENEWLYHIWLSIYITMEQMK